MTIDIKPIRPDFAAIIHGVDLKRSLDDATRQLLEEAIWKYGVLVFNDQPLTKEEQIAYCRSFGQLDTQLAGRHADEPRSQSTKEGILDLSNADSDGRIAEPSDDRAFINIINRVWHSDGLGLHSPFRYSILSAQSAVNWGGETQFADLRAAYDSLDDRTKQLIKGKTAAFSFRFPRQVLGFNAPDDNDKAFAPVHWPLVRTHPGSGRKLLWVDSKLCEISGMTLPEGRVLALELLEHITQRERVYTHTWRKNDVLMWDNRSVLHRGRRFDFSERRDMRRVSTLDDVLSLAPPNCPAETHTASAAE